MRFITWLANQFTQRQWARRILGGHWERWSVDIGGLGLIWHQMDKCYKKGGQVPGCCRGTPVCEHWIDAVSERNLGTMEAGLTSDGYHTFNELYEHRMMLFVCFCNLHPMSWKSKLHHDGTMFEGDWFIAGADLGGPGNMITYHLNGKYWDLMKVRHLVRAPEWDGHTSNDVLVRLEHWTRGL